MNTKQLLLNSLSALSANDQLRLSLFIGLVGSGVYALATSFKGIRWWWKPLILVFVFTFGIPVPTILEFLRPTERESTVAAFIAAMIVGVIFLPPLLQMLLYLWTSVKGKLRKRKAAVS